MALCRNTCGNCDGTRCVDSTSFNCSHYSSLNWCVRYSDTMAKYCPKSCKRCDMLTTAQPTTPYTPATLPADCEDDPGVKCSKELCERVPGTYLPKCKKTCGNCDGRKCTDSTDFNCAYYATPEVGYCTKFPDDMAIYCPNRCNYCDKLFAATRAPITTTVAATSPTNNNCVDDDPTACADVDQEKCDTYPGKYLKTCKSKCNNCDGSKCYNSTKFKCDRFKPAQCKTFKDLPGYCPSLCGGC